ncbi:NmrA family NAD(P)-binding protein [Lysinibacillus boronitolerans]
MDVYKKIGKSGGTGKEGRYIASKASEKGYHMRMLVRNQKSQLIVK